MVDDFFSGFILFCLSLINSWWSRGSDAERERDQETESRTRGSHSNTQQ